MSGTESAGEPRFVSRPHPVEGDSTDRDADFGPSRRSDEAAALDAGCPQARGAQLPHHRTANSSRSGSGHPSQAERAVAVFLDRDGVVNDQTGFVNRPDDFRLLPGAAAAVARLNRAGLPVVVITNQGGVAMGYLTEETLAEIHAKMERELAVGAAHVDAIYYCSHMPNAKLVAYLKDCRCRKPGIGMLEKARDDLGIDLRKSFLVGDATTDILAGIRVGCHTILVRTGFAGKDGKAIAEPDDVVEDLATAVDLILDHLMSETA